MDRGSTDGNKEVSCPGHSDRFVPSDLLPSDCGDPSLIGSSRGQSPSRQPWRKGYLSQDAVPSVPQQAVACHETLQPSVASDVSLSLSPSSAAGLLSLMSTPAMPTRDCGGSILTPNPVLPRELNDQRPLFRRQILSPSLMDSTQPRRSKMAFSDTWTQRLQNFNFHCLPLSPPTSDVLVKQENILHTGLSQMTVPSSSPSRDRMVGTSPEMLSNYESHQSAAVNAPTRQGYLNDSNRSVLASSSPSSGTDMFHSPHSSVSQPIHAWHPEALGASAIPLTPDIHGHDLQPWWPSISRVSQAPNQPLYASTAVSPIHEKSIQDVSHPSDLLQGGLMIHFDQSLDMSSSPESSIPFSNLSPATSHEPLSYPSHPTLQSFPHASGCGRTITNQIIIHQSRSPSMSPTTPTSSKSGTAGRNALNVKSNGRRVPNRKLSSQSTSTPKPAGRPFVSTSPKRASKTVNVSFVNFTPEDSHKILTGVAPSGSSKTKARREQEAREKRRKLSEAALMAVRNAGGDVEALEAVLC